MNPRLISRGRSAGKDGASHETCFLLGYDTLTRSPSPEGPSALTNSVLTSLVSAGLLFGLGTGDASATQFPSRFLLVADGSGYSTTMDFAPTNQEMQWRVLIKCVLGSTNKQYWATAKASGDTLKGQFDGRKSQNFIFNRAYMFLSVSPGPCRGGKAEIMLGIDE